MLDATGLAPAEPPKEESMKENMVGEDRVRMDNRSGVFNLLCALCEKAHGAEPKVVLDDERTR